MWVHPVSSGDVAQPLMSILGGQSEPSKKWSDAGITLREAFYSPNTDPKEKNFWKGPSQAA